jgi:dTDP-glucose pyrophosphorylase
MTDRMKPTLVILAAGIGSRYGGLKQVDPVGPNNEVLLDYAIYDARRAGFDTIVFVISRTLERDFKARFDARYSQTINLAYVCQDLDLLPPGFSVPSERIKPWGTGHAVLAARPEVRTPFAVINADDYYGSGSFNVLGEALASMPSDSGEFVMVAFDLEKTLSEHGEVARGVCEVREGRLVSIIEREKIKRVDNGIVFQDADGVLSPLDCGAPVSMNCWGFAPDTFFPRAERLFCEFLKQRQADEKAEFYLPSIINSGIADKALEVKVLRSGEQWFGMTYPQDRQQVANCIREKIRLGVYPERL